ncbi:MAG TPA: GspE/PulE family protein [Blastocatellia bacterium]|nr:GspE/PulE family protein [Blastocatellia bacterium]
MTGRLSALMRRRVWPVKARRDDGPRRDYVAEELKRRRSRGVEGYDGEREPWAQDDGRGSVALATASVAGRSNVALNNAESTPAEISAGIESGVLRLLTPQLAHEFKALPIRVDGSTVVFAVAEPPTFKLQNELRWLIGIGSDRPRRPVFVRIGETVLSQSLDIYYPYQSAALVPGHADLARLFASSDSDPRDTGILSVPPGVASVRNLVDMILMKAVYRGANDILFECFETEFRVRFKVEGECEYAITPLPPNAAGQVVSIVKQHARLDIAETDRSQDGRFDMKIDYKGTIKSIQFRVATRPTINGESCVVRLHDNAERRPRLASVGADKRTLDALYHVRDHRGGLVLFSGPTGSGKTTTLAAILGECDSVRENIVTIEDPVEIRLPGITQSAVNELKGETFSRLLRNTLRVAPDRILVGEIRDTETAHLVIKAALTGHQVLSTVHADDAPRSVSRILEEGASPFNLSSVLSLVVAQRLLNRLCEHCAEDVVYPAEVLAREQFSPAEFAEARTREARGCSMCHQRGTYGRIAIFETLIVSDEIRALIAKRPFDMEAGIRRAAIRSGMRPLRRCGLDLVKQGIVSLQQVADATPYLPSDAQSVTCARTVHDSSAEALVRTLPVQQQVQSACFGQATPDETDTLDVIRALIENARRDADEGLPVFSVISE